MLRSVTRTYAAVIARYRSCPAVIRAQSALRSFEGNKTGLEEERIGEDISCKSLHCHPPVRNFQRKFQIFQWESSSMRDGYVVSQHQPYSPVASSTEMSSANHSKIDRSPVSHICAFTTFPSTFIVRVANSTPMVDLESRLNSFRVNRESTAQQHRRQVLDQGSIGLKQRCGPHNF